MTVSVIIVGDDSSLRETLDSVMAAGRADLQIVVAAPPGAGDLDDLPQGVLLTEPPRPGIAAARNAALTAATGRYVAFLDAGDRYLAGALDLAVDILDARPELGLLFSPPGDPWPGGRREPDGTWTLTSHLALCPPPDRPLSGLLVRRADLLAAGGWDEDLEVLADVDLWRRLVDCCRAEICAAPLLVARGEERPVSMADPTAVLTAYACYADRLTDGDPAGALVTGASLRRLGEQAAAEMGRSPVGALLAPLLREQAARQFRPLVSIVIPVYNGADYLAEAIDSALAQTYENFEVIVVNDGSTDGGATDRVARSYAERIRYVSQPNGGVASALNRGVAEMRGAYFSWLSHDDLYTPDKLAVQVAGLARQNDPERCILYGDYDVFTSMSSNARAMLLYPVPPGRFRHHLTIANGIHGCTLLIPRGAFGAIGGFDPALRTTQDYDLWFRMAARFTFVHQAGIVVHARSHLGQGTHALADLAQAEWDTLLRGFVEQLDAPEVMEVGDPSPAAGYERLSGKLAARGFFGAAARAAELGQASQTPAEQGPTTDPATRMLPPPSSDGELRSILLRVTLERNAALNELDVLRAELAQIYGSRSWHLTAPLRDAAGWLRRWGR